MADLLLATAAAPSTPSAGQAIVYVDTSTKRLSTKDETGAVVNYPVTLANASAAGATGFATDTYLAGSPITIPVAGNWIVGETYALTFDMAKTGAGIAAFTITVRMGTGGTTSDAAVLTLAFGAGTANIDTGVFEVWLTFKSVGSGTSAVLTGMARCTHHLAATGLVSTGASGTGIVLATSSGFDSSTQTILGVSVNGGTSFSGTNTLVQATLAKRS